MDSKLKNLLAELDSPTISPSEIKSKLPLISTSRLSKNALLTLSNNILTICSKKKTSKATDEALAIISYWKEKIYPTNQDLFKQNRFDFLILESEVHEASEKAIESINCLNQALQLKPQDPSIHYALARIYKQIQNYRMWYICANQAKKILENMLYENKEFNDNLRSLLANVYLISSEVAIHYKNFKLSTTCLNKAKPLLEKLNNYDELEEVEKTLGQVEGQHNRHFSQRGRRSTSQSGTQETLMRRTMNRFSASPGPSDTERSQEPQFVEFKPDMIEESLVMLKSVVPKARKDRFETLPEENHEENKENFEPNSTRYSRPRKLKPIKSEREKELELENEKLKLHIQEMEERLNGASKPPPTFNRNRKLVSPIKSKDNSRLSTENLNSSIDVSHRDDEISRLQAEIERYKNALALKDVEKDSLGATISVLTIENENLKQELLKLKHPEKKEFLKKKTKRWKNKTYKAFSWIKSCINHLIEEDPDKYNDLFVKIGLNEPLLLNYSNRLKLFNEKLGQTKTSDNEQIDLKIRKEYLIEDSHQQLSDDPEGWQKKFSVKFIGDNSTVTSGGVKEWFSLIGEKIYEPSVGIFEKLGKSILYHPKPLLSEYSIKMFEFLGHFFSKALRLGISVPISMSKLFIKLILEKEYDFEDFEEIDPAYYKTLNWILENEFNPEDLDQYFVYEKNGPNGVEVRELVKNGHMKKVDNNNKYDYVNKVTRAKYVDEILPLVKAFKSTFYQMIPEKAIQIFEPYEFELLLGDKKEIKPEDLKDNTEYNGYTEDSIVIKWFWEVVGSFDQQQLSALLYFITGTSSGELKAKNRMFKISQENGTLSQIPKGHTCFWRLDLPAYRSKNELRNKLIMSITEGSEGYGLV